MGVRGLWRLIERAQEVTTLAELADRAFRQSPGRRGFRLGVDAPLWLMHAQEGVGKLDPAIVGRNAAVRTLFFRLCALLRKGILSLFVFDGPGGPAWKRGRLTGLSKGAVTELERAFTALLSRCGIPWRKAPGEAEAELAEMAKQGLIDAVLTDDGDALVFGAPLIIRNSPSLFAGYKTPQNVSTASQPPIPAGGVPSSFPPVSPTSRHACTLYSLKRIRTKLAFDAQALVLIALISGCDYTPAGLPGLGVQHTVSLISLGFANKLFDGLKARGTSEVAQEGRKEFVRCWREAVATALEREQDVVGNKQLELAQRVRDATTFPSEAMMDAWLRPVVVPREQRKEIDWDKEPDLARIVGWCIHQLDWSEEETANHLRNLLWKGLAMRHLRQAALAIDRAIPASLEPAASPILARVDALQRAARQAQLNPAESLFAAIHECKKTDSTEGVTCYRVELNPTPFERDINQHFLITSEDSVTGERSPSSSQTLSQAQPLTPSPPTRQVSSRVRFSHWISASFLEAGGPEVRQMIDEWEAAAREQQVRRQEKIDEQQARRKRKRGESGSPASANQLLTPTREEGVFDLVDSDDVDYLPTPEALSQSVTPRANGSATKRKGKRRRTVEPPQFDFSHIILGPRRRSRDWEDEVEVVEPEAGEEEEEVDEFAEDEVDELSDPLLDAEEVETPARVASPPRRGRVTQKANRTRCEVIDLSSD